MLSNVNFSQSNPAPVIQQAPNAGTFPEGPTWSKNKVDKLENRTHHCAFLVDHFMIVVGKPEIPNSAAVFPGKPSNSFAIDLKTNTIKNVIINGFPAAREGHTICIYKDNQFVLFGGKTPESQNFFGKTPAQVSNELGFLKLTSKNNMLFDYKQINLNGPARAYHTANIINDKMYVFGGIDKIDAIGTNSMNVLTIETGNWESPGQIGDIPAARAGHCSVVYNDQLYIFGGTLDQNANKDIFIFNPANNTWRKFVSKGTAPALTAYGTAQEFNGKAYFVGSRFGLNVGESDRLSALDLESFTWTGVKAQGIMEFPRLGHTSVLYENNLVIFGGNSNDSSYYSLPLSDKIGENGAKSSAQGIKGEVDTSKGQPNNYVADLGKMFMDSTFSDVTFTVQGQNFPGHKNILAMRCPHFVSMFTSSEGTQLSKVEVSDVEHKTFKGQYFFALLEFVYCNEVELDVDLGLDLLKAAHKYSFTSLKQICSEYLSKKLGIDNYVTIASVSEEYQAPILENAVLEYVAKNLNLIEQKKEYPALSKEMFWKIILKLGKK